MSERLKLKLLGRSTLKGKVGTHFPARVTGEPPIEVTQIDGTAYTIGIDIDTLLDALTAIINIELIIDAGGAVITTGIKSDLELSFDGTILGVTLLADQVGDIVVDIWKDTYGNYPPTIADSITGSSPPTLSSELKSQDNTLTGWDRTLVAGSTLRFNVFSASLVRRVTLSLRCQKDWSV